MLHSARQASKQTGIDHPRIARALFIIANAPDQIDLVLGGTPLETAYEEAQRRKRAADSDSAKAERLNNKAPDLAEQVSEGKLSLAEAVGALDVREKEEERRTEALRQARQLATEHLQKVLIFTELRNCTPRDRAAKESGIDQQRISRAVFIIENAPEGGTITRSRPYS